MKATQTQKAFEKLTKYMVSGDELTMKSNMDNGTFVAYCDNDGKVSVDFVPNTKNHPQTGVTTTEEAKGLLFNATKGSQ